LNIGYDLTKLQRVLRWELFLRHRVHIIQIEEAIIQYNYIIVCPKASWDGA